MTTGASLLMMEFAMSQSTAGMDVQQAPIPQTALTPSMSARTRMTTSAMRPLSVAQAQTRRTAAMARASRCGRLVRHRVTFPGHQYLKMLTAVQTRLKAMREMIVAYPRTTMCATNRTRASQVPTDLTACRRDLSAAATVTVRTQMMASAMR